jgi:hypothetical protein
MKLSRWTIFLRAVALPAAALAVAGCGGGKSGGDLGGPQDMAAAPGDFAHSGGDLGAPGSCLPDPMTDGQGCGNGCPVGSGTIPVNDQILGCKCWYSCTPMQNTCPCGRRCEALYTQTDMGLVANGMGACIPANGGGERCGLDANKKPYGTGQCQEGTLCVNEDNAGKISYCMYECAKQADCPVGTTCLPLQMGGKNVCAINNSTMGKAVGAACMNGDLCAVNAECDGTTCRAQCNGPSDTTTCTGGAKCVAFTDPANKKVTAWVCK